jgi:hypothetical protein
MQYYSEATSLVWWLDVEQSSVLRTVLFWVITQREVVISYRRFGKPTCPIFKGQESIKKAGYQPTKELTKGFAIPAFYRIAGLSDRHLTSSRRG